MKIDEVKQMNGILLFIGVFTISSMCYAGTYYVSPDGTASWSECTSTNTPCSGKTAVENAAAGDVVYFRGGIYDPVKDPVQQWLDTPVQFRYEMPVWNPKYSGIEGSPITFKAYPGETPELLDAPFSGVIGAYRKNYIVWDGFKGTIIDEDTYSNDTHLVSVLVFFEDSDHSIVRNCDFKGTKFGRHTNNSLIYILRSHYILIENNKLHDNNGYKNTDPEFKEYAVNTNAVINFNSSNITVRNNDFYNNYIGIWDKAAEHDDQYYNNHIWGGGYGIYIRVSAGEQGDGTNIKAYQNVIDKCGQGVTVETGHTGYPYAYPLIYNNTIIGRNDYLNNTGIYLTEHAKNAQIFNNIITGYPIQVRYFTGDHTIVSYSNYNNFYSTNTLKQWSLNWTDSTVYSSLSSWNSATGFDINSLELLPMFVNSGGSKSPDYKLSVNSQLNNAGIDRQDYDNDGNTTELINIGAYITGNEVIGYLDPLSRETTPPARPRGLRIKGK